jgi:hypothetical protein
MVQIAPLLILGLIPSTPPWTDTTELGGMPRSGVSTAAGGVGPSKSESLRGLSAGRLFFSGFVGVTGSKL